MMWRLLMCAVIFGMFSHSVFSQGVGMARRTLTIEGYCPQESAQGLQFDSTQASPIQCYTGSAWVAGNKLFGSGRHLMRASLLCYDDTTFMQVWAICTGFNGICKNAAALSTSGNLGSVVDLGEPDAVWNLVLVFGFLILMVFGWNSGYSMAINARRHDGGE